MRHTSDTIFGVFALAVMVGTPFVAEALVPSECIEEPAMIQEADKLDAGIPVSEDIPTNTAAELWSAETEWPEIEPNYDYIPLDKPLAEALVSSCEEWGVPLELALAVMEQESGFQPDAVNPATGCYGLMQLSPKWFPGGLSPEENIRTGVSYLGELLELYDGDQARAVTAYYYGPSDRDSSWYSNEVLERAEGWK